MEYKTGFKIKPYEVTAIGEVMFTDGTTDTLIPNQLQCEAYGYTYDRTSGTCRAFRYTPLLPITAQNTNNRLNGPGNTTQSGSNTIQINGTGNTTKGLNNNCFINGRDNDIENGINNSSILGGTYGKVQRQSEVVIGGGVASGINQTSIVQLGGNTEDSTPTKLTVQSDGSSWIAVQNNSIFAFEIKVIVLCAGGSSGTAGDYAYLELKGAIQVDNGYSLAISQSSTTIASVGLTGTAQVISAGVDPYITVVVTGDTGINLEWFASVEITEKKLIAATF
tara:strand:- start:6 stop:842 length:837 start_codon:yes stop_codon:yes gene_type:complete